MAKWEVNKAKCGERARRFHSLTRHRSPKIPMYPPTRKLSEALPFGFYDTGVID